VSIAREASAAQRHRGGPRFEAEFRSIGALPRDRDRARPVIRRYEGCAARLAQDLLAQGVLLQKSVAKLVNASPDLAAGRRCAPLETGIHHHGRTRDAHPQDVKAFSLRPPHPIERAAAIFSTTASGFSRSMGSPHQSPAGLLRIGEQSHAGFTERRPGGRPQVKFSLATARGAHGGSSPTIGRPRQLFPRGRCAHLVAS